MTTMQVNETIQSNEDKRFLILVAIIFLLVVAGMMLVFAATFIKDVATLRNVPDALWNFLCGTPTDNNVTLPLLLTIAIVCFGVSVGLQVWRWQLGRKQKRNEAVS